MMEVSPPCAKLEMNLASGEIVSQTDYPWWDVNRKYFTEDDTDYEVVVLGDYIMITMRWNALYIAISPYA